MAEEPDGSTNRSFVYAGVGLGLGAIVGLLLGWLWWEGPVVGAAVGAVVGVFAGAAWDRATRKFD